MPFFCRSARYHGSAYSDRVPCFVHRDRLHGVLASSSPPFARRIASIDVRAERWTALPSGRERKLDSLRAECFSRGDWIAYLPALPIKKHRCAILLSAGGGRYTGGYPVVSSGIGRQPAVQGGSARPSQPPGATGYLVISCHRRGYLEYRGRGLRPPVRHALGTHAFTHPLARTTPACRLRSLEVSQRSRRSLHRRSLESRTTRRHG